MKSFPLSLSFVVLASISNILPDNPLFFPLINSLNLPLEGSASKEKIGLMKKCRIFDWSKTLGSLNDVQFMMLWLLICPKSPVLIKDIDTTQHK